MSGARYLQIVREQRAGEISDAKHISYSGLRSHPAPAAPPIKLKRYNVPARVFAGPVVGLSVGATRCRRSLPKPKLAVVFDGYVGKARVFKVKRRG